MEDRGHIMPLVSGHTDTAVRVCDKPLRAISDPNVDLVGVLFIVEPISCARGSATAFEDNGG